MRSVVHLLCHAQVSVRTCLLSHDSSFFGRPPTLDRLLIKYLNEQNAQRRNVRVGVESAGSCLSNLFRWELKSRGEERALKMRLTVWLVKEEQFFFTPTLPNPWAVIQE